MKYPSVSALVLTGSLALALSACATNSASSSSSMPAASSTVATPAPAPAPVVAAPTPTPSPQVVTAVAPAAQPTAVAAKIDFDTQAKPFFATYCFQCHGPTRQSSRIRFDTKAGINAAKGRITGVLNSNAMPPESAPQPSDAEVAMIEQWIREGATISDSYPAGTPLAAGRAEATAPAPMPRADD